MKTKDLAGSNFAGLLGCLEELVDEVMILFMSNRKTFTAYDVTEFIRDYVTHETVKGIVHEGMRLSMPLMVGQSAYTQTVSKFSGGTAITYVPKTNVTQKPVPAVTGTLQKVAPVVVDKPTTIKTTTDSRVTIPVAYTRKLGVKPGAAVWVYENKNGYLLNKNNINPIGYKSMGTRTIDEYGNVKFTTRLGSKYTISWAQIGVRLTKV